jgi:hypothetical protein
MQQKQAAFILVAIGFLAFISITQGSVIPGKYFLFFLDEILVGKTGSARGVCTPKPIQIRIRIRLEFGWALVYTLHSI